MQISKKWKKIKLLKDADLVHQNSHVRRLNRLKAVAAHPSADGDEFNDDGGGPTLLHHPQHSNNNPTSPEEGAFLWQQKFFETQALWFAAWQHQQQISTNEENLQRPQEDEEIESYHLVNDCLDDVQIYAPPPFASAGSRKSSEEPNLITAGSIGIIGKFEY